MNLKRTIGTGKIFLYSCGAVIALAAIIWLIVNGIFAVYLSGAESFSWRIYYDNASSDVVTPWLLMAAAGAIFYRYCKMCSANNISGTKQIVVFVLLSLLIPIAFAAVDLLFTKLVLQRVYGGVVFTNIENDNGYFRTIVREYSRSLGDEVPEIYSPYPMNTLLLIFAFMTLYYYCFFITGCYMVQCFRYGRRKTLIYYAVTILIEVILVNYFSEKAEWLLDYNPPPSVLMIIALLILVTILVIFISNPIVFLNVFLILSKGNMGTIIIGFIMAAFYIFITSPSIEAIHLSQFPKKKRIRKALENYYAKNNYREEGIKQ